MATGDTWEVTCSTLMIRTGPGVSNNTNGYLSRGEKVTELGISGDGKWLKHDKGWSSLSYLKKEVEVAVDTTTENTPPDTSSGSSGSSEEGTGYQPDINDVLSGLESGTSAYISSSDFAKIKNVAGVFGLPYQFLPSADPRLENSSSTENIGYEYAERIVARMPLLLMSPGKASFMTNYSKKDKENLIEHIISVGQATSGDRGTLDDLLTEDGRYYTFEYDVPRYYTFVNPMCRIAARYLDIQDVVIDGQQLDRINWETFTKSRIKSIGDFGTYSSIPFYVDTETSISESHSNTTTQSMIASTVNSISDMGRELNFLLGYGASATGIEAMAENPDVAANIENVNATIEKLLGQGNFLTNLSKHLTTVAAGGRLVFPEIWADSSFSRSYSCEFKLVSPDPSPLSIYLNILVPLFHLLGFVCPQSLASNPNGYTNPFLVRAIYKGFFNVDMGIITDMSVTKGAECQWTPEGIPTSMNISITIKDLYQAMSITPTSSGEWKYDTLNNTALMDYIANLCGINIYKPEITRMIEMWYMNNFHNRVGDMFQTNIWSGIQNKVQNLIMGIYR